MTRSPQWDAWVQRAKATDIAAFAAKRNLNLKQKGKDLVGPCPRCGGDDRFAISTTKKVFNCRGCGARGRDVIALASFVDQCDFTHAVETVTGERAPEIKPEPKKRKPNGSGGKTLGTITATYDYLDAGGSFCSMR